MSRHCRRRCMLLGTAALLMTVLCIGVVHNAAIKRSYEVDIKEHQNAALVDSNDVVNEDDGDLMAKDGHAFEPDSLKEVIHELDSLGNRKVVAEQDQLQEKEEEEDDADANEPLLGRNVVAVGKEHEIESIVDENVDDFQVLAQPNNNIEAEAVEEKDQVLKFKPVEKPKQSEPILGVGQRMVENPKPLPIVKAPFKIDAYVDAHPKPHSDNLLNLDALGPPDHLDAVRMEQDGHINTNYQKEVFFGEHEEYENLSDEEMEKRLKEIFVKVDRSGNNFITVDELEDWIIEKTNEHFEEAANENKAIFMSLDSDSNGYISWKEFKIQFLLAVGQSEEDAKLYAQGKEEEIPLDMEDRERLRRYKFKWSDAEKEPIDNRLTVDEFQSFRHPESSKEMVLQMAEEILQYLDTNKDDELTEQEFISLPEADYDEDTQNPNWQQKRSNEFKNVIDTNHDGRASRDELVAYIDPQNRNHARMEARNLLELGDNDGDDRLSLQEVIDNMDLFYGSKMVNTGLSFHDEF